MNRDIIQTIETALKAAKRNDWRVTGESLARAAEIIRSHTPEDAKEKRRDARHAEVAQGIQEALRWLATPVAEGLGVSHLGICKALPGAGYRLGVIPRGEAGLPVLFFECSRRANPITAPEWKKLMIEVESLVPVVTHHNGAGYLLGCFVVRAAVHPTVDKALALHAKAFDDGRYPKPAPSPLHWA